MNGEMRLSKWSAISLFIWYIIVFVAGSFFLFQKLLAPDFFSGGVTLGLALTTSVAAGLVSSALFYLRKLYKGIFAQQNGTFSSGEFNAIEFATFIYFVSRPLFAVLFACLAVITSAMFIHSTTASGSKLSIGFIFFCILLSAYGAAATGRVVQQLEIIGQDKVRMFGGTS